MTEITNAPPPVTTAVALPAPAPEPAPEAPRVVLEDGNDVTDGIEPDVEEAPKKPRLKRRDLLQVSSLLQRNKIPVSEMSISLGVQFLSEKKAGETKLRFQDWLDVDVDTDDDGDEPVGIEDEFDEDGEGPTES